MGGTAGFGAPHRLPAERKAMKLRDQLIFRTIALAALVFGVFGAILIQTTFRLQFSHEKDALETRSVHLAQSMEAAAVNYVLQNITPTDELLMGVLSQLDESAVLYTADNAPADEGVHLARRTLYALRPISLAGVSYRLLCISDLSALYENRQSLLIAYSLLYVITMLIFALVMNLTARTLSRPIEQLAHVSSQLAAGQMSMRAHPDGTQEICTLARSFNQMADSLTGQIDRQQRFIADLTHEMKTPLTAIIGHADLIRSGRVDGDNILLAAQSIFKEGQRLNALSARLIDWILLEQDPPDLKPARVRPLIEESAAALLPSAANHGIELTASCDDAIISCDTLLLSALLSNLIDNALKSEATHVRVEGRIASDTFTLTVTDDGRGMDKESLSRITEPFYRVDKSRSRAQGGAGLGLALCAQIAKLHRSLLSFESEPGKGTRVALFIPGKEAGINEEI